MAYRLQKLERDKNNFNHQRDITKYISRIKILELKMNLLKNAVNKTTIPPEKGNDKNTQKVWE